MDHSLPAIRNVAGSRSNALSRAVFHAFDPRDSVHPFVKSRAVVSFWPAFFVRRRRGFLPVSTAVAARLLC